MQETKTIASPGAATLMPLIDRRVMPNGMSMALLQTAKPALARVVLNFSHADFFAANQLLAQMALPLCGSVSNHANCIRFAGMPETGAILSAAAAPDHSTITAVLPEKDLGDFLPLLARMIESPEFTEEEVVRQKEILFGNWKSGRRKSHNLASEQFLAQIFRDHPLGRPRLQDDFPGIDKEHLNNFWAKMRTHAPVSLYLAVHDTGRAVEMAEGAFGTLTPGSVLPEKMASLHNTAPVQGSCGSRIHISLGDDTRGSILMGRPVFGKSNPLYSVAKVASTLLGGYFSSRLMARLREDKGYAFGVGAGIKTLLSGSYLYISAEVGAMHLEDSLHEIGREIHRLSSEAVEKEELTTVKQYLTGNLLRQTREEFSQLNLLATLDRLSLPGNWPEHYLHQINGLTPEDISHFVSEYLDPAKLTIITCS